MLYRVRVVVRAREGVSDPEGDTLTSRLKRKGVGGVRRVRSGRYWEIYVEAHSKEQAEVLAKQIYTAPPLVNRVKDNVQLLTIDEAG